MKIVWHYFHGACYQVLLIISDFPLLSLDFVQAFVNLGELLISTDAGAALDAFKTVMTLSTL